MIDERFCRAALLLGDESMDLLGASHVVVCGLGAVGSYAVESLARLGVGHFTLIDFDEVRPSNINRQLLAMDSTVGQLKANVSARRILDINPACVVDAKPMFIDRDSVTILSELRPHLVIDAIDSLSSKVELIAFCKTQALPIVSSMGAALRRDPLRLRTGIIADASKCPLARHVRKRLRRRKLDLDIPCVYSDEPPPAKLSLAPPDTISTQDHTAVRGRKRNVLGSVSTITGMFGLLVASLALEMLLAPKSS